MNVESGASSSGNESESENESENGSVEGSVKGSVKRSVNGSVEESVNGSEKRAGRDEEIDVETAEKEADEMGSEEGQEDRGRMINEKVSRVRGELFGCMFSEGSKLNKAECREIISKFAKMEELLNGERRRSSALEGRLDDRRRERLHLRNALAA
ncbi:hypothetical protein QAD02_008225 [Eretmocerus hayati]|uniref:Uncharacterized protein n=1 Tax=Eretmocerus hayati TaxID=131215 RepID=A0ACC2N5W5_9HYME|nr:hypothetical protein QAD02_008225 [Eretmocerus hayati]